MGLWTMGVNTPEYYVVLKKDLHAAHVSFIVKTDKSLSVSPLNFSPSRRDLIQSLSSEREGAAPIALCSEPEAPAKSPSTDKRPQNKRAGTKRHRYLRRSLVEFVGNLASRFTASESRES